MRKEDNIVSYELKGEITGFEGETIEVVGGKKRDQQDDINITDMVEDIKDFIEKVGIGANIEFKLTLKETK